MLKQAEGYFNQPLCKVTEDELFRFVYHLIRNKQAAYATQKQIISALKLYFKEICNQTVNLDAILCI